MAIENDELLHFVESQCTQDTSPLTHMEPYTDNTENDESPRQSGHGEERRWCSPSEKLEKGGLDGDQRRGVNERQGGDGTRVRGKEIHNYLPMEASSAIWEAAECFCGFLNKKAAYAYHLEDNLKLVEGKSEKLEAMKKVVEANIEEHEANPDMQRLPLVIHWLNRVQSLQEEIKDILDRGTKEIHNKCLSKCCPRDCKSSYRLGKNVAKILRNVDELETEGEGFCKDSKVVIKKMCKRYEMPCGETVGLDLMFEKVWKSIEETNVGIIGLYGMGGVGKTTLLKKINNELGKRSDFYIKWVVVSKSPNLDSVMDNIRKSVGIGDDLWNCCGNQDEKAAKIYKVLKEKKFVLLLDDIWERLDLEKVGVPHPKENNCQSKVLFTTRLEDVCAKMKAQRTFKVEILTEKEALDLFCMKVGEDTLKYDHIIPKIAEEMTKECKGLPLALTVVGSAMAGVKSVEAWEHSKNNLTSSSWAAPYWETKVFLALKFSYDLLPNETHRKCFLYCALYPEDYEIRVHDVIDKWIGEGFLHNDRMRSLHDMHSYGGSIIEKLKLSCLLESVEDDIFLRRSIKMHDVIRDMALWVAHGHDTNKRVIVQEDAGAISQANVEKWEMVERISIMDGAESCLQSIAWTNLITLILKFDGYCEIEGLQNIQYARRLKVLELKGMKNVLYAKIGGLIFLEYIWLEVPSELMNASDVWRELKNLKNMKVFDLTIFELQECPLGLLSNLHQLKVFRLRSTGIKKNEKEFLEELEGSSNLEEWLMPISTEGGLNKLFESAKLQSCIYGLELGFVDAAINRPLLFATMSKMKRLQKLFLSYVPIVIDPSFCDTCCLSTLREVKVVHCHRVHHLTWLMYAPLLQNLVVRGCHSLEEVIKEEILQDDEKYRDHNNVDSIFPSLVELSLSFSPNLRSIHERVLPFPSLRSIHVYSCENLKKLPFYSDSAKAKLKLIRGSQEWWDNLQWDDPSIKASFRSKFQYSPPY